MKKDIGRRIVEKASDIAEDVDLVTALSCVAAGFAAGFLAGWWWRSRTGREDDGPKDQRIAMTYPFT